MVYDTLDICPNCWQRNAKLRLIILNQNRAGQAGFKRPGRSLAGRDPYGALWVCQNCQNSFGASIFVVL